MAFEIVDITLEERSRLRRLLADHIAPRGSTAEDHAVGAETPVPIGTQS
jgi:hypothetical protein